jgi:hypothetical protein
MKNFALVTGIIALLAAGAWAADFDAKEATASPNIATPQGYDATYECKWDSGGGRWWIAWYTGAGSWVGNDFDISTIKTYGGMKTLRTESQFSWPNTGWDGFRVGIYAFAGGIPGSMMWPTGGGGYFFKPSGPAYWQDIPIGWVLPSGVKKFVAAVEQFYNYPNCDPFMLDGNPTFVGHSWQYYEGKWEYYVGSEQTAPYRNVMVRMVIDNEQNPAVLPMSAGRVKALYY